MKIKEKNKKIIIDKNDNKEKELKPEDVFDIIKQVVPFATLASLFLVVASIFNNTEFLKSTYIKTIVVRVSVLSSIFFIICVGSGFMYLQSYDKNIGKVFVLFFAFGIIFAFIVSFIILLNI